MILNNKKGLSTVIATILLIALTLVAVSVVWVVVNNILNNQMHRVDSCYGSGIADGVKINHRYTCYNSTSNEFQFSVEVGNVDLTEVLVGISGSNKFSNSLSIKSVPELVNGVRLYSSPNYNSTLSLPERNSGLTYVVNISAYGFGRPDSLKLSPVVDGVVCEVADSTTDIDECIGI